MRPILSKAEKYFLTTGLRLDDSTPGPNYQKVLRTRIKKKVLQLKGEIALLQQYGYLLAPTAPDSIKPKTISFEEE